jgi:hypothetical protein
VAETVEPVNLILLVVPLLHTQVAVAVLLGITNATQLVELVEAETALTTPTTLLLMVLTVLVVEAVELVLTHTLTLEMVVAAGLVL